MTLTPLPRDAALRSWQRFDDKVQRGSVGNSYARILSLVDDSGRAPLTLVLSTLFPGEDLIDAHRALATQIINRPPKTPGKATPLRLQTTRLPRGVAGEARFADAWLWFVGESLTDPIADGPPPNPRYDPAHYVDSAFALAGPPDEVAKEADAMRQALAEAHVRENRDTVNLGLGTSRHGARPQDFVEAAATVSTLDSPHHEKPAPSKLQTPVLQGLFDWALNNQTEAPHLLALLGDAGTGKTSHLQHFDRVLNGISQHPRWEHAKAESARARNLNCLFIDLSNLAGVTRLSELSLEEMLEIVLKKRGVGAEASARVASYLTQARAGEVVMVFDGLDELLNVDSNVLHHVFGQLLRVLEAKRGQTISPSARAIVSCRTHYFRSVQDQHAFFDTRRRGTARAQDYFQMTLLPWTAEHIEEYIRKIVPPKDVDKLLHTIRITYNLQELATRPVLLAMMAEQIDKLVAAGDSKPITAARMYDITVAEWIARDNGKHQIRPEHKPLLMGALAAHMWDSEEESLAVAELEVWLEKTLPLLFGSRYASADIAALQNDLRTATFIARVSDERFVFGHRSFQEYFLARYWVEAVRAVANGVLPEAALRSTLPSHGFTYESFQFLREMWDAERARISLTEQAKRASALWSVLQGTATDAGAPLLRARVFDVLIALGLTHREIAQHVTLGADSPLNLRGLSLAGLQLGDADFSNLPTMDLRHTSLIALRAERCTFGSVLTDDQTVVAQAVFRDCDLSRIDWGDADTGGMIVRNTGLTLRWDQGLVGPWSMPDPETSQSLLFGRVEFRSPTELVLSTYRGPANYIGSSTAGLSALARLEKAFDRQLSVQFGAVTLRQEWTQRIDPTHLSQSPHETRSLDGRFETLLESGFLTIRPLNPNAEDRWYVVVPFPLRGTEPSWAEFDMENRLTACNEAAIDHWLFALRDGQALPIEAVL